MKKTIFFVLALCCALHPLKSQNSFGQILYPHTGSKLSSGIVTTYTPGFLMAGYNSNSAPNFFIDRTDVGGIINGTPAVFQREYSISSSTGGNCSTPVALSDCSGITVIETNLPNTAPLGAVSNGGSYALAGSCSEGCFFSVLSANGTPVTSMLYQIPLPVGSSISKPLITEASTSMSGNKEYFICGSCTDPAYGITGMVYALRIDRFGAVLWSTWYLSFYGEVKDMIEDPYNPGLLIVGKYGNGPYAGFIVNVDPLTGGYNPLISTNVGVSYYSDPNRDIWFSSISIANSPSPSGAGFILGGSHQPINNTGSAWILKLNPNGSIQWNKLLTPSSDPNAGDIVDIIERQNQSNNYEYYGITNSQAGILCLKLTASGLSFGSNDEFVYDAGTGSPSVVNSMSFSDNAGADNGLHIFGTDQGINPSSHYFTEAYFNGYMGCNTPKTIYTTENGSPGLISSGWYVGAGPTACNKFKLTSSQTGGFNPLCGPFASVGSGSNAREATTGINENIPTKQDVNIYPNPTSGSALLKYNLHDAATVTITLYNHLGQLVKTLYNTAEVAGAHEWIIDFNELNVESGLYFVTSAINGQSSTQKVVYTK